MEANRWWNREYKINNNTRKNIYFSKSAKIVSSLSSSSHLSLLYDYILKYKSNVTEKNIFFFGKKHIYIKKYMALYFYVLGIVYYSSNTQRQTHEWTKKLNNEKFSFILPSAEEQNGIILFSI